MHPQKGGFYALAHKLLRSQKGGFYGTILGGLWGARQYLPLIAQALSEGSADSLVRSAVNSGLGSEVLEKLELLCEAASKLKRIYGRGSRLRNAANKAVRQQRLQKGGIKALQCGGTRQQLQKGGFYGVGIKRLYGLAKKNVRRKALKLLQGMANKRRHLQKGGFWGAYLMEKTRKARQKGGILPALHPNDAAFFTEALRKKKMTKI